MNNLYKFFTLLLSVFFVTISSGYSQCPDGQPAGGTAYDTTIVFETGITSMSVKFAQFDPQNGMVTCVRLCVTITGVVDTIGVQNRASNSQTATITYDRTDQITGPGLSTPLSNSITKVYSYNLTPYDGIPNDGTDFASESHDTVLNKQLCNRIDDGVAISQFYGTDSVTYTYDINASVNEAYSGGNKTSTVLTSALVNFHFEYCTCPATVLPVNIYAFNINKLTKNKVDLKWSDYDDAHSIYSYEAEVSRDGNIFSSIGSLAKNTVSNDPYKLSYTAANEENGIYYFRIKQVYANGYVRYSNIRHVALENSASSKFSVYPNPSSGIVGIKFDNTLNGDFNVLIYNTQGQMTVSKDIVVVQGSSYRELARLVPGVYWLRLTDKKSLESSVNQFLIK